MREVVVEQRPEPPADAVDDATVIALDAALRRPPDEEPNVRPSLQDLTAPALHPITHAYRHRDLPDVHVPAYDRTAMTAGIAHIGVGNFHRVHQGVYLDDLLQVRDNQHGWAIVGIGLSDSPAAKAKAQTYERQDCLYSVNAYSPTGRRTSRIVGSMIEYLYGPDDPAAVVDRLSDPAIRIVSLTVTEGGYFLDEQDGRFRTELPHIAADLRREHPQTTFGVLTAALRARRAAGTAPFTVLSCDNLRGNGDTARAATAGYAAATDAEFAAWIKGTVAFPNSMVDRIAPTVSRETRGRLNSITGLDDGVPTLTEQFSQWVVEDVFPTGRPAWEQVGVQLRSDPGMFEAIKGRLLNASHMLLSYPAALASHEWVHDACSDPAIAALLTTFMRADAAPLIRAPSDVSLTNYQRSVIDRFTNPNVPDTVLRVAHDGAAKLPVFHRATCAGLLAAGKDIRREALLLAAFRRYLGGVDDHGTAFEVDEPHLTATDWPLLRSANPLDALRSSPFAAWSLTGNAHFVDAYTHLVRVLDTEGIHAAIRHAL